MGGSKWGGTYSTANIVLSCNSSEGFDISQERKKKVNSEKSSGTNSGDSHHKSFSRPGLVISEAKTCFV